MLLIYTRLLRLCRVRCYVTCCRRRLIVRLIGMARFGIQRVTRIVKEVLMFICGITEKWSPKIDKCLSTTKAGVASHAVVFRGLVLLQVLEKCGLPSIECLIIKCQLRWTGHIVRMEDDRIPKMLLYGQLKEGHRDLGRPFKRYKDTLKANLKSCYIDVNSWEATARDRALWKYQCTQGTKAIEVNRAAAIQAKKERRKQRSSSVDSFPCSICGRSWIDR